LVRPRRDRTMGSSILASLSEAGGNDPCHPVNGPLPPHSPDDADRVGTRPTPLPVQIMAHSNCHRPPPDHLIVNDLEIAGSRGAQPRKIKSGHIVPHWYAARSDYPFAGVAWICARSELSIIFRRHAWSCSRHEITSFTPLILRAERRLPVRPQARSPDRE
jgi:hypothetical protein